MSQRKYDGRHAGGGDLGEQKVDQEPLAPCPSCGAMLATATMINPHTGREAFVLTHPMPFCGYYGSTPPEQIVKDMLGKIS